MRHLVVTYGDGTIAILYPVARNQLSLLDLLTQRLLQLWIEKECKSAVLVASVDGWQLIEAIGKLIRSHKLLPFKLAPLKTDVDLVQRLFLANGEKLDQAGELVQLHLYEPHKRKQTADDGVPTLQNLPFPTCGNNDNDTIGNLLTLWQPSEVERLMGWLDAESIDQVMHVFSELNRGEERLEEFIHERDRRLLEANRKILNEALGLPSYYVGLGDDDDAD
ncbi:hypothetical protein H6F86_20590 [Phormidium sp. FACHB-592]|uniref:Uncharacterized protein n=1 Tax=Stenomitos frigidus AS-A4 TaxID=2933935 RepID=A0ABV0KEH6_9CYAN|nr:hypothetical protein [Phormidium sp. FACHB-592]MBD2076231.1 hypothetical protein [Phormidium sp. FACHB-592]